MPDQFQPVPPTSIKFRLQQGDSEVAFVGLAIAANSKLMRVRYFEHGVKQEVEIPKHNVLPLKQAAVSFKSNQTEVIRGAIARLEREREGLQKGAIAPENCWIEVKGRARRQAWWRSHCAMFESAGKQVKSCLIGEEGSLEHEEAKRQRHRRDRLKQIEQDLQRLLSFERG